MKKGWMGVLLVALLLVGCAPLDKQRTQGSDGLPGGGAVSEEELQTFEEAFSHMEYNSLLTREFSEEEALEWEDIYEERRTDAFVPEEFRCVSGKRLQDVYTLRVEPVEEDLYNPPRLVTLKKQGDRYDIWSVVFLWEERAVETYDVDLPQYAGEPKLILAADEATEQTGIYVISEGQMRALVGCDRVPQAIADYMSVDLNNDGLRDLVILMKTDEGLRTDVLLCDTSVDVWDSFTPDWELNLACNSYLSGVYESADVREVLMMAVAGESHESYQALYKEIADYMDMTQPEGVEYSYRLICEDGWIPRMAIDVDDDYSYEFVYRQGRGYVTVEPQVEEGPEGQLSYTEFLTAIGSPEDKVTLLEGEEITFTAGGKQYTLYNRETNAYWVYVTLEQEEQAVETGRINHVNGIYLVERADGTNYLYLSTGAYYIEDYLCEFLIFNLNGDCLLPPTWMEGNYSMACDDITDTRDFQMQMISLVETRDSLNRHFYLGADGMPKPLTEDEVVIIDYGEEEEDE